MLRATTPSVTIEDGELTPPVSPSKSYDEDHMLPLGQSTRPLMETVGLSSVLATSASVTNLSRFLSYVLRMNDKDIAGLLSKLAKNQIQFTFQMGSAPINLKYFQDISAYSTKELTTLGFEELAQSFGFQDDLEVILEQGVDFAAAFANDFIKLNNQAKALSEREINSDVANLRMYIKNIAACIKREVEKKFPGYTEQKSATKFAASAAPKPAGTFFQAGTPPVAENAQAPERSATPIASSSAASLSAPPAGTLFQPVNTHPNVNNADAKVPLLGGDAISDKADEKSKNNCCCVMQ
jgi:hypothetical protein